MNDGPHFLATPAGLPAGSRGRPWRHRLAVLSIWSAGFSALVAGVPADYMVFPRLLALAEIAWSPSAHRTATSPVYHDFLRRLGGQGARLQAAGVNFYPSAQVSWPLTVIGATETANAHGQVHGAVATLSAPGFPASTLTMCDSSLGIGCTIKWGDGSTSTGDVTGTNATGTRVNSRYTIFGTHTYAHPGTYRGVAVVSAGNSKPVRANFTVTWP
jgi:hexosaminidase